MILLGAPGVGKGTYGAILSKHFGIPKISTGDILRQAVAERTALGRQAQSFMDSGRLVPDEIIINMVAERLAHPDAKRGFILDGFPRTLAQAQALEEVLARLGCRIDVVWHVDAPLEVIIRRLTNRRICPSCGSNFNVLTAPPRREGVCDHCGTALIQRTDDQEEVIQKRYAVYEFETKPLIAFYRSRGLLKPVDSHGSVDEVMVKIFEVLNTLGVKT